jgi:hypothetical protein
LPFVGRSPCLTACCTTASTLNTTELALIAYPRNAMTIRTCGSSHLLHCQLLSEQPLKLLVPRLRNVTSGKVSSSLLHMQTLACSRNTRSCSNSLRNRCASNPAAAFNLLLFSFATACFKSRASSVTACARCSCISLSTHTHSSNANAEGSDLHGRLQPRLQLVQCSDGSKAQCEAQDDHSCALHVRR